MSKLDELEDRLPVLDEWTYGGDVDLLLRAVRQFGDSVINGEYLRERARVGLMDEDVMELIAE